MTKKHFEEAAKMVKAATNLTESERKLVAAYFAGLFSRFNPRFDTRRFNEACGVE